MKPAPKKPILGGRKSARPPLHQLKNLTELTLVETVVRKAVTDFLQKTVVPARLDESDFRVIMTATVDPINLRYHAFSLVKLFNQWPDGHFIRILSVARRAVDKALKKGPRAVARHQALLESFCRGTDLWGAQCDELWDNKASEILKRIQKLSDESATPKTIEKARRLIRDVISIPNDALIKETNPWDAQIAAIFNKEWNENLKRIQKLSRENVTPKTVEKARPLNAMRFPPKRRRKKGDSLF